MNSTATASPLVATARPDTSPWPIFFIASVAVFLVSLDSTMLFAAFNALRTGFPGASAADLSWVLNAYTVVYATMLIPSGGLADRHGRKRVFMIGVAIFLAASAACGLAGNVQWLIFARVVQAVGAALLTPASLSLVLDAFPQARRSVVVSMWGAVSALAAAIGPSLGSLVADSAGWQWAFYLNLPLGAVSLWCGASRLRESSRPDTKRPLDVVGMVLLVLGVGAIALAIVQADSPAWQRSDLLVALATGIVALLAFVAWARATPTPLLDLTLFQHRSYRYVNLATLAFGMAFAMMFFAFFFYMMGIWHYSMPLAGLAITPGPLLVIPAAIVTGRLAARHGHRPFLVGGSLVYACAGLWFLLVPGHEPAYLRHWLPGLLLSGLGVGMVLPALSAAAVSRLPARHYAVGSAVNQATRQIGSVMGVAVTVLWLGAATLQRADFTPVYGLHVALALLTGLLCLAVDTRPQSLAASGQASK
ncbi:DHA2 family efflux MFS transporter permease subunit [Bordetella sp. BOR01]|uniref:DHA2 family efflux MFS transporter permease subunit n=1 Tax=Bordetella sp. BOR01 TaxID=2854779 RepID=UPI001C490E38|nr:DHA2 family efflux MFS transporter permease subunit [Bordetella sp. BOR01]MBV7484734.1 DHA2 family efflux MFS transporter permease subunit [Bordetella sp. BOR01]